tara:strand:+ start:415 stop:579 length:165 start_codon:yes stop_codon:yes gene_type:complete
MEYRVKLIRDIPHEPVNLRPKLIAHPNCTKRYIGCVGKKAVADDFLVQTVNAYE